MAARVTLLWWVSLLLCSAIGCSGGSSGEAVKLQGAGASFPAPLYNKWFKDYRAKNPNVLIDDYQSVGSGAGVKAVKYDDQKKLDTLKSVIQYCLTEGQNSSEQLGYIPLPPNVVEKVKKALDNLKMG
jgi:ABC-type phosphate transport system substrate-binding protein